MQKGLWLIGLVLLMGAGEKPVASLTLKNGHELKVYAKPAIEKNMVAVRDKKGRKILISKGLIDWESTRETTPEVYLLAYPEKAKTWLANRPKKKTVIAKPKKRIVITNDTLDEMSPDEGIAGEWVSDMPAAGTPAAEATKGADFTPVIQTVRGAKKLDVRRHMVAGRLVVFDFYADWCGPCRQLTPQLESLVKKYPNRVALKKVDIIRWGTPVADQFNIRSIPYVEVYDERGKRKLSGNGFRVLSDLKRMAKKKRW